MSVWDRLLNPTGFVDYLWLLVVLLNVVWFVRSVLRGLARSVARGWHEGAAEVAAAQEQGRLLSSQDGTLHPDAHEPTRVVRPARDREQ